MVVLQLVETELKKEYGNATQLRFQIFVLETLQQLKDAQNQNAKVCVKKLT